jgi:alkyl sulfatase BDS1-like metallo-beta-lactamase superfamily hydrolase
MAGRGFLLLAWLAAMAVPVAAQDAKPAQPDVAAANRAVLAQLPFEDRQDFEDTTRGFVATTPGASPIRRKRWCPPSSMAR